QAELARPWETIILPARLRHGRAGVKSIEPKHDVRIELSKASNGTAVAGTDQVQITYQIFEGMTQPQPGPGPLAEAVRAVIDLDHGSLGREQRRLEQILQEQFGSPGLSIEPVSLRVSEHSAEEDQ